MIFSSSQAVIKEIAAIQNCEIAGWQKRQSADTFFVNFRVFKFSCPFDIQRVYFVCVGFGFNSPRSIYSNSYMTGRLSGHFSIFGLVFFESKSSGNCETMES